MFSNYVKTMKNSGLRATPALVHYRLERPKKQEVEYERGEKMGLFLPQIMNDRLPAWMQ